jgi:putative glutamine amidotransferase
MQQTYLEGVWRAGGNDAMIAPRPMTTEHAKELLSRVDGLILVGGGDIDPALFGQTPHPQVYGVDAEHDSLELALVHAAIELGVPTLAICRGMQVLNVALGGNLHQHITREPGFGSHGDPREGFALHGVSVEPGTLLAKAIGGSPTIDQCWSFHHQALDQLGDGLRVTAVSDDGAIEAVEFTDADRSWMLGVQWHPERTAHTDHVQQGLFDELIRQSSSR